MLCRALASIDVDTNVDATAQRSRLRTAGPLSASQARGGRTVRYEGSVQYFPNRTQQRSRSRSPTRDSHPTRSRSPLRDPRRELAGPSDAVEASPPTSEAQRWTPPEAPPLRTRPHRAPSPDLEDSLSNIEIDPSRRGNALAETLDAMEIDDEEDELLEEDGHGDDGDDGDGGEEADEGGMASDGDGDGDLDSGDEEII